MKHNLVVMDSKMIISSIPRFEFYCVFYLNSSFINFSFFIFCFALLGIFFQKATKLMKKKIQSTTKRI